MDKFKVGDRVRKKNGDTFSNGNFVETIVKYEDSYGRGKIPWVSGGWVPSGDIELVEPSDKDYNTVSKPEHYNHGEGIECIEYIKQVLGPEGFVAYCRGNLMKYNHRAMYKGKPVEDLEKAEQYLKWVTETLKEMEQTNG